MRPFIERIGALWAAREPRERVLLGVLAALLAALVYAYGLFMPLQRLADSGREQHEAVAAGLARARSLSAAIRAGEAAGGGRAPSPEAIRRSAEAAGVPISGTTPESGGLAVSIEAAGARPLLAWLAALQRDDGVGVRRFEAQRGEDGMVQATVVLAGPAR